MNDAPDTKTLENGADSDADDGIVYFVFLCASR